MFLQTLLLVVYFSYPGLVTYISQEKDKIKTYFSYFNLQHIITSGTQLRRLFLKGIKLNIPLVFISKFYLKRPKDKRLKSTRFCHKIPNKRKHKQIALNDLSDIEFNNFMNLPVSKKNKTTDSKIEQKKAQ